MNQFSLFRIKHILWLCIFFVIGCTEIYNPELEVGSRIMYIEGMISDTYGPHKIHLRYAANFNDKAKYPPVTGAIISIREDGVSDFACSEISEGVYQTDESFIGKKGHSYTLIIETPDGNVFESSPQLIPEENIPISAVYGLKETRTKKYYNNYGEFSVLNEDVNQIYADIPVGTKNTYYRFRCRSILENVSRLSVSVSDGIDLVGLYVWESFLQEDLSIIEVNTQLDLVSKFPITNLGFDPDDFTHLKYARSDDIHEEYDSLIIDTIQIPFETDTGIVMVDTIIYGLSFGIDDFDIFYGWILLIDQYSITRDAYTFWSDIKKLEETDGEIFDPIATQLRGNMQCVTDEELVMLGLFEVASKIVTPAFVNFSPTGDQFLGKTLPQNYDVSYRGWQDSIPPVFWVDKIQPFTSLD